MKLSATVLWFCGFVLGCSPSAAYASSQELGASQRAEVERWIDDLGGERPEVRQAAEEKLLRTGWAAEAALRKALLSTDAETRARTREILDRLPVEFTAIRTQPSKGFFRFSPDGSRVAFYPSFKQMEIQDATSGLPICSIPGFSSYSPPAFSPDGRWVYTVLKDKKYGLFDPSTGKVESEFSMESREGAVWGSGVLFRPLAGGIILYDFRLNNSGVYLPDKNTAYSIVAFRVVGDAEGRNIFGLYKKDERYTLHRFNVKTLKVCDSQPMDEEADRLEAPRDTSRLYVASDKGCSVSVYDPLSLKMLSRHVVFKADGIDSISCMAVSPDGRWLAAGYSEGEIKIFRAPEMKLESTLEVGRTPIQVELTDNAGLVGVLVDGRPKLLKLFRRR